jgi:two-component system response regulator DesR
VLAGAQVIDPKLAPAALSTGADPLSPRERDVLGAATDRSTATDIARLLHLSAGTVRDYLSSAIRKTGAHNRLAATRVATENGWL